jgi:hypothetical protein
MYMRTAGIPHGKEGKHLRKDATTSDDVGLLSSFAVTSASSGCNRSTQQAKHNLQLGQRGFGTLFQ